MKNTTVNTKIKNGVIRGIIVRTITAPKINTNKDGTNKSISLLLFYILSIKSICVRKCFLQHGRFRFSKSNTSFSGVLGILFPS